MHILSYGVLSPSLEAEPFPEDDIDLLFEKLQTLEPPGDIMKQILARIKQLPVPRLPPQGRPGQSADKAACAGLEPDLHQSPEKQEAAE